MDKLAFPESVEIIEHISEDVLWLRVFSCWAWEAGRNANRTVLMLQREFDGSGVTIPTPGAIRHRVSREDWHDRAARELASGHEHEIRQMKHNARQLLRWSIERSFDAFTGTGREVSKEEISLIQHYQKMAGWGTYGANQGGEMQFAVALGTGDEEDISPEERRRRVRDRIIEENTGNG